MAPKELPVATAGGAKDEQKMRITNESDDDDMDSRKENSSSGSNSGSSERSSSAGKALATGDVSTDECIESKQRTRNVKRSKALVYLSLLAAAVTVGTLTYIFTKKQEQYEFQVVFTQYAEAAYANVEATTANLFGQVHLLGVTLTSHSLANGAFPAVTIARFDRRSGDARELSGASLIFLAPIVKQSKLAEWEQYAYEQQSWVYNDWSFHKGEAAFAKNPGNITPQIYPYETMNQILASDPSWQQAANGESSMHDLNLGPSSPIIDEPFHVPIWETGPVPTNATIVNFDVYTHPEFKSAIDNALEVNHMMLSGVADLRMLTHFTDHVEAADNSPSSFLINPIYDDFYPGSETVAFLFANVQWREFFLNILPPEVEGILVDIRGTCGDSFSFLLNGPTATYLGAGSYHDKRYEGSKFVYQFAQQAQYDGVNRTSQKGHCDYKMTVYPTVMFEETFYTNKPTIYCVLVVMVFFLTLMFFMAYDLMIYRRQAKLQFTAERTKAIVTSLFPKEMHDRILHNADADYQRDEQAKRSFAFAPKTQIKQFLHVDDEAKNSTGNSIFKTKPIADLFPQVTIMYADLVGFTAWSSMREPAQVFNLLETIYYEFDQVAMRRRVFKVETIGDCYVAVCGLPEPRHDHAIVMSRFARDCLYKLGQVTKSLEVSLGPDTNDLGLRVGLHSGPVTAGVLRGERARFQLFGDAVNITARIENTGAKNMIHLSPETAELLQHAGKGHWTRPRENKITATGKGEVQTFWLEIKGEKAHSMSSGGGGSDPSASNADYEEDEDEPQAVVDLAPQAVVDLAQLKGDLKHSIEEKAQPLSEKNMRLVSWNVEILSRVLREQVVRREARGVRPDSASTMRALELANIDSDSIPIDEIKDIVDIPAFDADVAKRQKCAADVDLGSKISLQLQEYTLTIAALYRDNPFHNFEHASHVTMSVVKLLSRIVAPDIEPESQDAAHKVLHDHTFGINSSPLTQFAVILAALIHDVDHTGVPNSQLVNEDASIAVVYKQKSIAEQNSFEIAWDLLMQDCFEDLRRTIYQTEDEFKRFRQMLVQSVLSTDIMDKELAAKRKERWKKAFAQEKSSATCEELTARKATIVIEHLIQTSDVAHTMQHWHIYRKWNARLFEECWRAWKEGRSQSDPAPGWFRGEMGFFDFYIIPLAKKLKDCGVFGVFSDEYLNYALQNRREFELKGEEIVAEMVEQLKSKTT
ncbi:hypothetical protein MPSEU_000535300 [Mayamaea pseudoterrestris]|nr:hypothetical protein MPSEU_000535300 [Mayamaea pseudoterrestris]